MHEKETRRAGFKKTSEELRTPQGTREGQRQHSAPPSAPRPRDRHICSDARPETPGVHGHLLPPLSPSPSHANPTPTTHLGLNSPTIEATLPWTHCLKCNCNLLHTFERYAIYICIVFTANHSPLYIINHRELNGANPGDAPPTPAPAPTLRSNTLLSERMGFYMTQPTMNLDFSRNILSDTNSNQSG